jgi:NTP pyrophosphatase (non-canonical NTP hydrolase)
MSKLFDGKLNQFCKDAYQNSLDHGFYDNPPTFLERMSLIHSEISEAVEEYRNGKQPDDIYYRGAKPEGIPVELADALIRIADFCGRNNIDLEKAIEEKHAYNVGRPYKHGKIA